MPDHPGSPRMMVLPSSSAIVVIGESSWKAKSNVSYDHPCHTDTRSIPCSIPSEKTPGETNDISAFPSATDLDEEVASKMAGSISVSISPKYPIRLATQYG